MKTASEVIESYVRDVAGYLPRAKRNDVAFELRALLHDELAAKAAREGRAPDRAMAMELLAGFGRPAEAAARYHPRPPLIDPADNHSFLIWAVVGAIVFQAAQPENRLAALHWVGVVFLFFSLAAWWRRRNPARAFSWRPTRGPYPEVAGWWATLLPGFATLVFPFAMYLAPRTWWELVSLGRMPSSGLELSEAFLGSWLRGVTLLALGLVVTTYLAAAGQGGWRRWSRRGLMAANVLVGLMLAGHARPGLEVFTSPLANAAATPIFGGVGGAMLLACFYDLYREWARVEPAPSPAGSGRPRHTAG
jgi:hypothetical protein